MTHQIHAETELGEVKLKVSDLEQSLNFYQDVIGFSLLTKKDKVVELTADGKKPLLILEEISPSITLKPRTTTGLYHFAILVPNRKELSLSLRNLISHNIPIGQADHLVSEALYLSDPDNNGIEIYRDRPRESWRRDQSGDYIMASDPLDWEGLVNEGGDTTWNGLSLETKIGHIHLHAANLEEVKSFYCGLLGFDVVGNYVNMDALFLSAGGYHHHIGLNTWAGVGAPVPPDHATGIDYYTMFVPDLDSRVETLRKAGVVVQEHEGAVYVKDPSGVVVKLQKK